MVGNPLSAAFVTFPVHKVTSITYEQYKDLEKARVRDEADCFVLASDCNGQSMKSAKQKDKLFRVQRRGYYGHPDLKRKECRYYPADALQPMLRKIESSTDGC